MRDRTGSTPRRTVPRPCNEASPILKGIHEDREARRRIDHWRRLRRGDRPIGRHLAYNLQRQQRISATPLCAASGVKTQWEQSPKSASAGFGFQKGGLPRLLPLRFHEGTRSPARAKQFQGRLSTAGIGVSSFSDVCRHVFTIVCATTHTSRWFREIVF